MATKLIKICKELNVGMATLTAWCEQHGYSVESHPNFMIEDNIYFEMIKDFRPDMQLPPKSTNSNNTSPIFTLKPGSSSLPKVIGKIDLSLLDSKSQRPRFPKSETKERQRKPLDPDTEKLLESVSWSCGVVSLFVGQEYGLIKNQEGKNCFFHPGNCDEDGIKNSDFVIFKPLFDYKKKRDNALHIHRPKAEDGFTIVCDYFWQRQKLSDMMEVRQLNKALMPYAQEHWILNENYKQIISDLKPYLICCSNEKVLNLRCETILGVSNNDETFKPELTLAFFEQLADIVFPELEQECLLSMFIRYRADFRNALIGRIDLLSDENKKKFIQSYFVWNCVDTAKILMQFEKECSLNPSLAQKCLYDKFHNIPEIEKARLYFMGFDRKLLRSLSDSIIKQFLIVYESASICQHYQENRISREIIVAACCEILKNASRRSKMTVEELIRSWTIEMPEVIEDIKKQLRIKIDDDVIRLWEHGLIDALTLDEWVTMLRENENSISSISHALKYNLITKEYATSIIKAWYLPEVANIKDKTEIFAYDQLFLTKCKRQQVDTDLLRECGEFFPIIIWYDSVAFDHEKPNTVVFDTLAKYFYLFSEEEQVKIFRFLFHLFEEGKFDLSVTKLQRLSTKSQRTISRDNTVHVCFSIDLVIEALSKFSSRKDFLVEREIILLALETQENVDFRSYNQSLIQHFFDLCKGLEWRKYVDDYDNYGRKKLQKKLLYKNCGRKKGVIFCEGRKMTKKDEMGGIRYLCRNSYCYGCQVSAHTTWQNYTLYDFCKLLHFDLKDKDSDGYYSDDGKYLKFMSWLNRAAQFVEHLYCRECGKLMKPSSDMSRLGVSVSTNFECFTPDCPENGKPYYLSHCLNTDCVGPIDGRDSKACPNGWLICPQCGSCCSTNVFERRYRFLRENGYQVPPSLKRLIDNNAGHAENEDYFCYKCGSPLEAYNMEQDIDHICTNPACRAEYHIGEFHRPKYNAWNVD